MEIKSIFIEEKRMEHFNVLLVDDEEAMHRLLSLFMARAGYRCNLHSAYNGKTGVEMYNKLLESGKRPHIVLMDLRMPGMDGVEATEKILEIDPDADIYLFTAYAKTEIEKEALKHGAKGTINKTADWNKMVERIVDILRSKVDRSHK